MRDEQDVGFRVAVLLNARAGKNGGPDEARVGDQVASAFARRGVRADIEIVSGDGLRTGAKRALARFRRGEVDAVAVGGGDGSIRTVAEAIADSDLPLGVLPLGTLNHFARDLGIALDLQGAVDVICAGATRAVDVAEVNGRVFVNNSSIGIYPFMVADRDRRRAVGGRAKWTAMALAIVRMWRRFPLRRLTLCVAGRAQPLRTPCLFVGNNEYHLSFGALGRREALDAGQLWLCASRAQSRMALFWLGLRSALGLIDRERDLQAITAPAAEIRSRTSRLLVALDGEIATLRPPLQYRIRPGALRVLAPEHSGS